MNCCSPHAKNDGNLKEILRNRLKKEFFFLFSLPDPRQLIQETLRPIIFPEYGASVSLIKTQNSAMIQHRLPFTPLTLQLLIQLNAI